MRGDKSVGSAASPAEAVQDWERYVWHHPDGGAKYIEFHCFEKVYRQSAALRNAIALQEAAIECLHAALKNAQVSPNQQIIPSEAQA